MKALLASLLLGALMLVGCDSQSASEANSGGVTGSAATNAASDTNPAAANAPADNAPGTPVADQGASFEAAKPKAGDKVAVLETNSGRIVFAFLPDKAPKTVASFQKLAGQKFYDNTAFHRVIPGFMIQGGDPYSDPKRAKGQPGTGGPGFALKAEFNDTPHVRGVVSMARSSDPDSAGSQFFICVAEASSLNNQYTAFGRVVSGMDAVDKIVALERDQNDTPADIEKARVKTVRIETWPLK